MEPLALLVGATGYVGQEFCKHLAHVGVSFVAMSGIREHVSGAARIQLVLRHHPSIKVVINCGGFVGIPNVDACELHKDACLYANAILPSKLAQACAEYGVSFGQVGSGCIYEGGPFSETDQPNFDKSWYSMTKLRSEELLSGMENVWVWRIRMPFNGDFSSRPRRCLLSKLASYDKIVEGLNSLTYLPEFVSKAWECVDRNLPKGVWNMVHPDPISNSELVNMLATSGLCEDKVMVDLETFKSMVKAPRSICVLSSDKAKEHGIGFSPVREAVSQALKNVHR